MLLNTNPTLGKEDICVLLVTHHDTEEGRERTQRLFTNINRNAKATTKAENIALDVDDAFALLTRRLLDNHVFLREDGRVRVFSKPPTQEGLGQFSLAPKQIPPSHPSALTSITALYELTQNLCYDSPKEIQDKTTRPTDELLKATYVTLAQRIDDLLESCGNVRDKLEAANSAQGRARSKGKRGDRACLHETSSSALSDENAALCHVPRPLELGRRTQGAEQP